MQKAIRSVRRHAAEFLRRFRQHDYEVMDGGLYFPRSRLAACGAYALRQADGSWQEVPNLVTLQGREYLLKTALGGQAAQAGWYLALFGSDYTPTDALTAAAFPVAAGEIVSATDGYSDATRRPWQPGPVSNAEMSNEASPATFNIVTPRDAVDVYGAALLSAQARGSTDGVLLSAARFRVRKQFENGEPVVLRYRTYLLPE